VLEQGRDQLVRRHAFLLLIAWSTSASAAAQSIDPSIEQISTGSRGAELRLSISEEPRTGIPPAQLATGAESSPATPQVTRERRSSSAPDQLSTGGKTAQQPQPLSQPADGRQAAVERVVGADRCDPAEPMRPRSRCATVIENRSAEFARPDPNALSPEQRLLLEQEVREGALSAESGARRLATTGQADESLAAMGVAATVLRPNEEVQRPSQLEDDVAKAAADIVGAIINQPLTP
jgi:hypothetical protein